MNDKLLWVTALWFLVMGLSVVSTGLNAINDPNNLEHEDWKIGIYVAIIPLFLSALVFYFIFKRRMNGEYWYTEPKQCGACNKVFPTHNDFANHVLYLHPPIQTCPNCGGYMRYSDFCVNPKEEWTIYKCEECGTLGDSWKVL